MHCCAKQLEEHPQSVLLNKCFLQPPSLTLSEVVPLFFFTHVLSYFAIFTIRVWTRSFQSTSFHKKGNLFIYQARESSLVNKQVVSEGEQIIYPGNFLCLSGREGEP